MLIVSMCFERYNVFKRPGMIVNLSIRSDESCFQEIKRSAKCSKEWRKMNMGIQLGIVGYGGMGGFHHRNASKIEGVQVVGAYDIDPVRVQVAEESGSGDFLSLEDLALRVRTSTLFWLPCRTTVTWRSALPRRMPASMSSARSLPL